MHCKQAVSPEGDIGSHDGGGERLRADVTPVIFGALKMLFGTSQRPGAPILQCRMSGVTLSTWTESCWMSGPSMGIVPEPFCVRVP